VISQQFYHLIPGYDIVPTATTDIIMNLTNQSVSQCQTQCNLNTSCILISYKSNVCVLYTNYFYLAVSNTTSVYQKRVGSTNVTLTCYILSISNRNAQCNVFYYKQKIFKFVKSDWIEFEIKLADFYLQQKTGVNSSKYFEGGNYLNLAKS
jgi:hypothetical protein